MRLILCLMLAAGAWGQMVGVRYLYVPSLNPHASASAAPNSSCTISSTDHKAGVVFSIPKSGTITDIIFGTGAVTTSQPVSVGLETVDTSTGFPSGSAYGSSAIGALSSVAASTAYTVSLGTPATATAGDMVSIVVQFSGTAGNFAFYTGSSSPLVSALPRGVCNTGSWASTAANTGASIKYSDGTIISLGGWMPTTYSSTYRLSFNSGTATTHSGNAITLPVPMRVVGAWFTLVSAPAAGAEWNVEIADQNDTVVASTTVDGEVSGLIAGVRFVYFSSPVIIPAGVRYTVYLKPNNTNSINDFTSLFYSTSANLVGADFGASVVMRQKVSGTWAITDTQRRAIGYIVDGVYAGSGGFSVVQ